LFIGLLQGSDPEPDDPEPDDPGDEPEPDDPGDEPEPDDPEPDDPGDGSKYLTCLPPHIFSIIPCSMNPTINANTIISKLLSSILPYNIYIYKKYIKGKLLNL